MGKQFTNNHALAQFVENVLEVSRFRDYCPNGLQVEGAATIDTIVTGVTASLPLIQAAIKLGAQAIVVHHGYFWRGEDARIIGIKHKRLQLLLAHNINLFAYHLPLDAHPILGNNAQLAKQLGFIETKRCGEQSLVCVGALLSEHVTTVEDLVGVITSVLGRAPLVIGDLQHRIKCVAWCTGAAQNSMTDAIAAGADVYISGEISEPTVHLARESGVVYLACGHHATERYGIQALGQHIAAHFGVAHHFVDIDNPV